MQKSIHKQINDGVDEAGVVTVTRFVIDSPRAAEIDGMLKDATLIPREIYDSLHAELSSICKHKSVTKHNLCVQSGRNVIAGILGGETTYTGIINYGVLGTSLTAVADTDTQLGAEVKRKSVATRTRINDQLNFDFYFSKSDTSGTFQEFGMVIDGTASANTGQLFNRLLTGGWTKSLSESLTVSVQININHA